MRSELICLALACLLSLGSSQSSSQPNSQSVSSGDVGAPSNSQAATPEYLNELLRFTNEKRAIHGVPPLRLNDHMNTYAQNWANHLAQIDDMVHRPNNPYGENINGYSEPQQVIDTWYAEGKGYDYNVDPGSNWYATGHFTQLVWKSTAEMGCGRARASGSGNYYVVCNYNPPGNYDNEYVANVLPPQ